MVCLFYNTGLFHNRNNCFQSGCSPQAGVAVTFPLWVYEGGQRHVNRSAIKGLGFIADWSFFDWRVYVNFFYLVQIIGGYFNGCTKGRPFNLLSQVPVQLGTALMIRPLLPMLWTPTSGFILWGYKLCVSNGALLSSLISYYLPLWALTC